MDAKAAKRVIAREGLIFLPLILLLPFLLFQRIEIQKAIDFYTGIPPSGLFKERVDNACFLFWLVASYALMVIIRFITWAIRTLREK